jgi:hypothetical protein
MLTQTEIVERERLALAKCADFETTVTEILNAFGSNPFFLVYDLDGKPWPIRPDQMTAGDILKFVHARYGPLFLSFAASLPELIVQ